MCTLCWTPGLQLAKAVLCMFVITVCWHSSNRLTHAAHVLVMCSGLKPALHTHCACQAFVPLMPIVEKRVSRHTCCSIIVQPRMDYALFWLCFYCMQSDSSTATCVASGHMGRQCILHIVRLASDVHLASDVYLASKLQTACAIKGGA